MNATRAVLFALGISTVASCGACKPEEGVHAPYAGFWLDGSDFMAVHDTTYFPVMQKEVENLHETPLLTLVEPDGDVALHTVVTGGVAERVADVVRRTDGNLAVVMEEYPVATISALSPSGALLALRRIRYKNSSSFYSFDASAVATGEVVFGGKDFKAAHMASVLVDNVQWAYKVEEDSDFELVEATSDGSLALISRPELGAIPRVEDRIHRLDSEGIFVASFILPKRVPHWSATPDGLAIVTEEDGVVEAIWYDAEGSPTAALRPDMESSEFVSFQIDEETLRIATVGRLVGGSIPIVRREYVRSGDQEGCDEASSVDIADVPPLEVAAPLPLSPATLEWTPSEFSVGNYKDAEVLEFDTSVDVSTCP